jgi:hypothetical protein
MAQDRTRRSFLGSLATALFGPLCAGKVSAGAPAALGVRDSLAPPTGSAILRTTFVYDAAGPSLVSVTTYDAHGRVVHLQPGAARAGYLRF